MAKVHYRILVVGMFLVGCGRQPGGHRSHDAAEPKVQAVPRVDGGEVRYYYTVNSSVKSRYEVNDKKMESEGSSELGFVLKMEKDSGG